MRRRLGPEEVSEIVARYVGGVATPQLCRACRLSKCSVLKLLYGQGVHLCREDLLKTGKNGCGSIFEILAGLARGRYNKC